MILVRKERARKEGADAKPKNTGGSSALRPDTSAKNEGSPILTLNVSPSDLLSLLIGPMRETTIMRDENLSFEAQGNAFHAQTKAYAARGTMSDTTETPQRVQSMIDLAVYYLQTNQNGAAGKLINHILRARGDVIELFYARAIVEARQGDVEGARVSLGILLDKIPGHPGGLQLAQILAQ
jgi:hypothetical protein